MKVEMLMPQMGESITEATVLKWLKNVGDTVDKDEIILEISTDKVDSEIPAPESGVITELIAQEGDTVSVKSVIAMLETDASAAQVEKSTSAASKTKSPESKSAEKTATPANPVQPAVASGVTTQSKTISLDGAESSTITRSAAAAMQNGAGQNSAQTNDVSDNRYYSPLVKSIAQQHGLSEVELASIPGTGTTGRVSKKDLQEYLKTRDSKSRAAAPRAAKGPVPTPDPSGAPNYDQNGIAIEPMNRMRQLIADHMVRSKSTSPHVYSVAEVDVTNIALARKKHQAAFVAREGFKLSFTPFFLLAAVKGLIQYPRMNSSVDGKNIILKRDVNLGVAVALGTTGLIVPVIKKADQLSLAGIASQLKDLAERARSKKLKPDETQGGTFTVTNPGVFGNIIGCPIINQPQAAILATCAIKKRPMVINDMIAIRQMMNITLSYDHRIIDGSLSGHFLHYITQYIENWDPEAEIL